MRKNTAKAMIRTPHRFSPQTGVPEVHPEVALVANELRRQPEKFQASVCGPNHETTGNAVSMADSG